jgi:hypothetical protein
LCFYLGSTADLSPRLSRLGASPRARPDFAEGANNFWLDPIDGRVNNG